MSKHSPVTADGLHERRTWIDRPDPDALQATIVEEVAEAAGVEPTAFDPLYEAVDPDALARLFRDSAGLRDVSFVYVGYRVRLFAHGELVVRPTA